jgi:hypothetical protein
MIKVLRKKKENNLITKKSFPNLALTGLKRRTACKPITGFGTRLYKYILLY